MRTLINTKVVVYGMFISISFVFLYVVYSLSVNVPYYDDYDLFLRSLTQFKKANSLQDHATVLWQPHNEHRPVWVRVISTFMMYVKGECNFRWLILLGNVFLLGAVVVLYKQSEDAKNQRSPVFLLLVMGLFLGLQSSENIFWATGALQNFSTMFFVVMTLRSLVKDKLAWTVFFMLLSVFSGMTGFLLFPLVILHMIRRGYFQSLIWMVPLMVLMIAAYFYHYHPSDIHAHPLYNPLNESVWSRIQFLFCFIGSAFCITGANTHLALGGGVFLCIVWIMVLPALQNKFWLYAGLFVLLCAVAGAYSRAGMGLEQAIVERYRIWSELFILVVITGVLKKTTQWRTAVVTSFCIITMVAFIVQWYTWLPSVKSAADLKKVGMIVFLQNKEPALLAYPHPGVATAVLIEAMDKKVYTPSF